MPKSQPPEQRATELVEMFRQRAEAIRPNAEASFEAMVPRLKTDLMDIPSVENVLQALRIAYIAGAVFGAATAEAANLAATVEAANFGSRSTVKLRSHERNLEMGQRTLKRVPMDFDWPLRKVWQ